jgi:hypothetical protein
VLLWSTVIIRNTRATSAHASWPNLTERKNLEALIRQSRYVGLNCENHCIAYNPTLMERLFFYINILLIRDGFWEKTKNIILSIVVSHQHFFDRAILSKNIRANSGIESITMLFILLICDTQYGEMREYLVIYEEGPDI